MNDNNRGSDWYEQEDEGRGRRMTGTRDESYGDRGRRNEGQWDRSREWNGGNRGGNDRSREWSGNRGYEGGNQGWGGYQGGSQGGSYQGGGFQDRGSNRSSYGDEGGNGSSYLGGGGYGPSGNMGQSGGNYGSSSRYGQGGDRWGMGNGGSQWNQGGGQRSSQNRGFSGRGPKAYQRSDERIREDVNDRLTDDSWLDASEITVEVKNGEVTLTGTVEDREQKRRAEDCAEQVSGVREVTNNIRVDRMAGRESGSYGSNAGSNAKSPATGSSSSKR